jgi:hypothetical protein
MPRDLLYGFRMLAKSPGFTGVGASVRATPNVPPMFGMQPEPGADSFRKISMRTGAWWKGIMPSSSEVLATIIAAVGVTRLIRDAGQLSACAARDQRGPDARSLL